MKRVVALLGSRRKRFTLKVLEEIGALLALRGVELEIVPLYQVDIKECIGCERCILHGDCVLDDGTLDLMNKLEQADGVILASPVYLQQVSGRMKTFVDRTCRWYHRPALAGKPILAVATTKGSGLKATLSYLENVATQWGAMTAGRVGRSILTMDKPVADKEIEAFVRLLQRPESYRPTLGQLIGFEVQKSLAQILVGIDTIHWNEKGWQNQSYFFPCRVNPLKRFVSGCVGRAMRKGMAKRATSLK